MHLRCAWRCTRRARVVASAALTAMWLLVGCTTKGTGPTTTATAATATIAALEGYHVYRGNTHSHTTYTSSHGLKPPANGTPAEHHAHAKVAGFDFYATTDHSQEVALADDSPTSPAWLDTKAAARAATSADYVGLAGFEFSENDGAAVNPHPGQGHINVIGSDGHLNAAAPGVDVPALYAWLATAKPSGDWPVVASFNHPAVAQYHDWDYRTPAATETVSLLEVLNHKTVREDAFRAANNHGWKVAPTCGIDNHAFWLPSDPRPCVGVLAAALTPKAILEAMHERRTFAALDGDVVLAYTANGRIMGSTLERPATLDLVVSASDPDKNDPAGSLTRIEVVDGTGALVASEDLSTYSTTWKVTVPVAGRAFVYVRLFDRGSGGAPIAWAAPVWTGFPPSAPPPPSDATPEPPRPPDG
jgi:hypothetical protein